MKSKNLNIFTNGIIKENPVLRLMLGTCPTLADTTAAINGIGMGVAAIPIPIPFIAAVVTASVGQVPSIRRKTGFSLMIPFVKTLSFFDSI